MPNVFLSKDWFAEVDKIIAEVKPPVPEAIKDLIINFRVKGAPDGDVEARMEAGRFLSGFGTNAPATVNVPFDVARKMIVENDQGAAMQAFMSGQIVVEGDMTRLMAMSAGGPPSAEQVQVGERIRAMTA